MRSERGLTLIELIVVLIIIMVLSGILLPVLWKVRLAGLKTKCRSNMQQISKALMMYRDDHMNRGKELNPPWLRTLLPVTTPYRQGYLGKEEILLCPMDTSYGKEGGKPDNADKQYAELDEYKLVAGNWVGVPCSYMYEFNMAAECIWTDGWWTTVTLPGNLADADAHKFVDLDGDQSSSKWGEVKTAQMRYGDKAINTGPDESKWHGYSPTRFPILRCFWHAEDPDTKTDFEIINMAYQGNLFLSTSEWERKSMQ